MSIHDKVKHKSIKPEPQLHRSIQKLQKTVIHIHLGSGFMNSTITEIRRLETFTSSSKKVHVNLLQQVDGEGVDLREKAHQEGDWKAVGKTCLMHEIKDTEAL